VISWLRLRLFRLRWWKVYRRARQLDQAVYVVAPFGPLPKGLKEGPPLPRFRVERYVRQRRRNHL